MWSSSVVLLSIWFVLGNFRRPLLFFLKGAEQIEPISSAPSFGRIELEFFRYARGFCILVGKLIDYHLDVGGSRDCNPLLVPRHASTTEQ